VADIYFDSVNGSDSNNGSTPALAKQSYDAYAQGTMTAGDTYWFKRGTTQTIVTANTQAKAGSSDTVRTKYRAYGEAQVPYSIWVNPSAVGNQILNVSGRSYIDFEDMYFDGQNVCIYSMYILANVATQNVGHRIARCYFTNMAYTGSGLVIGGTATSTGATNGFVIEDCHFFGNRTHGLLVNGANGVIVRRSKFYWNGSNAAAGGHGFSAKARRTDATSGWTNTSGTIWQRNLASHEPDVYYVKTTVSGYQRLAKTAGTQTAPLTGEFGVAAGVLYININSGTNPASQGVNYAWGRCYDIIVEDCEAYENIWDVTAPDHEGHGFALDDYTESSILRRNYSHHNQGSGFTINRGDNNTLESNVAHDNWLAGLAGSACWNPTIKHNTFYNNNTGAGAYNGEVAFSTYAKSMVISNNVLKGSRPYGIDIDATCSAYGGGNNCVAGYGAVDRTGAFTASITDDPILDAQHRATAATVKRAGSYVGGRDFYGKYFTDPPSIGAVSDHRTPGWAAAAGKRP
jgi:parallel beta-helix repeat protein